MFEYCTHEHFDNIQNDEFDLLRLNTSFCKPLNYKA